MIEYYNAWDLIRLSTSAPWSMEVLNTLFQVSDIVGFDDHIEDFPLAAGTVLSIRPEDRDHGTDECIVVQVGPNVLGIYRAEQLVRLRSVCREESRD